MGWLGSCVATVRPRASSGFKPIIAGSPLPAMGSFFSEPEGNYLEPFFELKRCASSMREATRSFVKMLPI